MILQDRYETALKKRYPSELLEAYACILTKEAAAASNRKRYQELVHYLKKLGSSAALAGNKIMPVCGFNDIPTQIASYCVPDDLSHRSLSPFFVYTSHCRLAGYSTLVHCRLYGSNHSNRCRRIIPGFRGNFQHCLYVLEFCNFQRNGQNLHLAFLGIGVTEDNKRHLCCLAGRTI